MKHKQLARLRNRVKIIFALLIAHLLYLNLLCPIAMSFEQIYLICFKVVLTCNKREVDGRNLSTSNLGEIKALAKKVLKKRLHEMDLYVKSNFLIL